VQRTEIDKFNIKTEIDVEEYTIPNPSHFIPGDKPKIRDRERNVGAS
jgi:hypothetical protein